MKENAQISLAILGAGPLQKDLILKAQSLGLKTHVFGKGNISAGSKLADYFYEISTRDSPSILESCRQIGIKGICSVASDSAVESWYTVASELNLVSNPIESIRLLRNKDSMYKALDRMVKLPKTEKIKSMPKSFDSFPCVVKPLDLWGSQGVSFADSQAALSEAIGYAQASQGSEEVLISEYVEGDEYSLESISFAGIHYPIAITRKITSGPPHFVELEHHLPSGFPDGIREKLYAMASLILETLKHRFGASHIEFKLREDEIIIMEVAGRMAGDFIGSHLIPLYTGYDYLKGAIDVSLGSFSPPDISKDGSVGIVFESETNASLFQELRGKKEIPPEIVEYTFDEEMSTTALSSSSERGSYFIYKAEQANPIR